MGAHRDGRRRIARAAFAAAACLATGTASAAVAPPHTVAVLANSSGVELTGYPSGDPVTVDVLRNGIVIGTASGLPAGGDLNVNPTVCWRGFVPEILPGDAVRVTSPSLPGPDTTVVRNVTVDAPQVEAGTGDLVIHGTAADANGDPLPVDEIANRVISSTEAFHRNGKLRLITGHPGAPGEGVVAYDAPGSTHWTARYAGLDQHDLDLARSPLTLTRGLWANLAASEVTIMIAGAAPAAVAPCGQPVSRYGVTAADPPAVNIANAGVADLVLSGASTDATHVDVTVDDGDPLTPKFTSGFDPSPVTGPQTWTVTVPAATVSGFAQGTLTASAVFTTPGGQVFGTTLEVLKDLVAPDPPTATPGAGTLSGPQWVTLSHGDAAASRIHYTVDGADPTGSSPVYGALIPVMSSLTVRAIVVDPAGNPSAVAAFPFLVAPAPPAPPSPAPPVTSDPGPAAVAPALRRARSACRPMQPSGARRAPCRVELRFDLSRAARMRFVVRSARGRLIGTFERSGRAGANVVPLPRRLGSTTLRPGAYRVAITVAAAGSAERASVALTIPAGG